MTTTNSYNFSVTRDQLIDTALQHIQAIGEGVTANASQLTECSRLLNMLMKSWAGLGMPLWAIKRGYVLPFTGTSKINTDSHVVLSYTTTTTSVAAASAASTITVTSVTGFSDTYVIGIEQDDDTMHWTTINGAPAGSVVTLTTALTAAAASGNRVYTYATTVRVAKPLRILDANILQVSNNSTWEITQVAHKDFYALGGRTSTGVPNQFYYDLSSPSETNLDAGIISVFPRFAGGDYLVEFSFQRPFQDFDAGTDNPDCPQEFYLSLMVGLASLCGPKFGVAIDERRALMSEAKMYRDEALESITPEGSLYIQPERRI